MDKKIYALLAISLLIQSFSSVFIKLAGRQEFLSFWFVLYYIAALLCLGVFAVMWQNILEKLPLSTAYMRKGITYVLIMIWSVVLFGEQITVGNIIGCILIIAGVTVNCYDN